MKKLLLGADYYPEAWDITELENDIKKIFNNTKVYSSSFLPEGTDYIVMVNGAVAQPVHTSIYNPKKVDLSDATAFGLFAYKGTKAVMEDLIIYKGSTVSL